MGSAETYFKAAAYSINLTFLHQAARVETK